MLYLHNNNHNNKNPRRKLTLVKNVKVYAEACG